MNLLREKLRAFAIHFVVTLAISALAACVIFFVWFPEPFDDMLGGTRLFLLVSGCDLALGPLISLVIYNSRKPRRELITDYTIVGIIQLAALVYGMYAVAGARPVYVAFAGDRIEVVSAGEIAQPDLAEAREATYQTLPLWGTRFVGTRVLPEDRNDALEQGLAGRDVTVRPKFYVPYESQTDAVKSRAQAVSALSDKSPGIETMAAESAKAHGVAADSVRWLPAKHRRGFWTALIDSKTGYPFDYLPVDPY